MTGQLLGKCSLIRSLVLDHPHGEFEQFQDHRSRLGLSQFGVPQDFRSQGVVQHIGGAGKEQP